VPDFFNVGKTNAILVPADASNPKRITNSYGGKLYYKNTSAVTTSDTEIAVGASRSSQENLWIISENESKVTISAPSSANAPGFYAGNWNPVAATSGTDTTPAEKKLFLCSVYLPITKTITGIGYLVGSVGGTNKAIAGLFNSDGVKIGNSSETTEGTTVGTAAEQQELPLTAAIAVPAGLYYIGITMNGNTARLRTIPKNVAGSNVFAGEVTLGTKNVLANVTAPTSFTADKGPVGWVY
jgi:hypothetical protein